MDTVRLEAFGDGLAFSLPEMKNESSTETPLG